MRQCKALEDISGKNGLVKRMLTDRTEQILEAALTDHSGYEKQSPERNNSGNNRNGKTAKIVRSDFGEVTLEPSRDRNGTFEAAIVEKCRSDISEFDEKISSMIMFVRKGKSQIKRLIPAWALTFTYKGCFNLAAI